MTILKTFFFNLLHESGQYKLGNMTEAMTAEQCLEHVRRSVEVKGKVVPSIPLVLGEA